MVEVIKSSFIPKKEIKRAAENKRGGGSGISIFLLISLIIFLSTVVGGIGMAFWKTTLEKENRTKKELLLKNKEKYGLSTFNDIIKIDKKIKVAKEVIDKHYAISPIFDFINKRTLPDVAFSKMNVKEDGDYVTVQASGKASEFSDLVRQSELYNQNPNIEELAFINITSSKEDNRKIFDMSFKVNKKWLTTDKLITQ